MTVRVVSDEVRRRHCSRGEFRDVGDDVVDKASRRLQVCRLGNQLSQVQLV